MQFISTSLSDFQLCSKLFSLLSPYMPRLFGFRSSRSWSSSQSKAVPKSWTDSFTEILCCNPMLFSRNRSPTPKAKSWALMSCKHNNSLFLTCFLAPLFIEKIFNVSCIVSLILSLLFGVCLFFKHNSAVKSQPLVDLLIQLLGQMYCIQAILASSGFKQ